MRSFTFLIIALLALLSSTATAREGNSRYHAAKCLAKKKKCTTYFQRQSGVCLAGRYARNQPSACHKLACAWCKVPGKGNVYPCNAKNVRSICRAVNAGRPVKPYIPPSAARRPPTTRAPTARTPPRPAFAPGSASVGGSNCVYSGSNMAVVNLGSLSAGQLKEGWTRTSRGGMKGIVYKAGGGGGIEAQRAATTMCFKMRVSQRGDYLATAVSAAPHSTEHNDMWISSSLGFKLIKGGAVRKSANPGQFLKGYQNNGGNKIVGDLATVDHDAHNFVVPNLGPGKTLTYCISGRSTRYEVFKLIIARCTGANCLTGRPQWNSLVKEGGSRCV